MLVRVFNNEHSCDEWCLLEFQGEILGDLTSDLGNIEVKKDVAFMDLGQHTLEGAVVKLKTSFLVVEKERKESSGSISVDGEESNAFLSMQGVVRHKIIFKQRPRPKPTSKN